MSINPGIGVITGTNTDTKFTRMYNNQFFDYLSEQLPQNHKEMFKWCEVVYSSTPVIVNGIKKLINYPVTDFTYASKTEKVKEDTTDFVEETLKLKTHLIALGLDYYVYGNAFRSIYFPFIRHLKCTTPSCDNEVNITHAQYKMKKGQFVLKCSKCNRERIAKIIDKPIEDYKEVSLIAWDPKNIELHTNPITGKTVYYYKLPKDIQNGILKGVKNIVETIPAIFLEAYRTNKAVEFNSNFYHFKATSIAGFSSGWGISPLIHTLKLFLYTSILRKSVEAIGLEHITPKKILFPQASSSDPTLISSMSRWKTEVTNALNKWRADPNFVMLAPYPTGQVDLSSNGRSLMPTAEIEEAERNMLRALDIPTELVYGVSNLHLSSIALRVLENQLTPYVTQLKDYSNWVIKLVNTKFNKNLCYVGFTPFTLADDIQNKSMIMNLLGNGVSKTTILETLGVDPQEERDRIKQDAINQEKDNKETAAEIEDIHNSIAERSKMEAKVTGGNTEGSVASNPNIQQEMIAQAENIATNIYRFNVGDKKKYLNQLKEQNFAVYCIVVKFLEDMTRQEPQESAPEQVDPTQQQQ